MADKKISALAAASTPLAGTEVLPIVQSSETKQVSVANLTVGRAVTALSLTAVNSGGKSTVAIGNTSSGTYSQLLMYGGSGVYNWSFGAQYNVGNAFEITPSTAIGGTTFSTPILIGRAIGGDIEAPVGNFVLGTAAKGINFTANTPAAGMTSQLLNWYEEGTWTPTVATGIDLPTYATQTGRYTRIGRIVHVQCYLSVNGGTRNGGQLTVGGLPFTMGTFAGAGASISLVSGGLAAGAATNALPTIEFTGTSAYFYKTTGADFLGTDLSSATFRVDFSGAYNV